jgi:hypothetical protein
MNWLLFSLLDKGICRNRPENVADHFARVGAASAGDLLFTGLFVAAMAFAAERNRAWRFAKT